MATAPTPPALIRTTTRSRGDSIFRLVPAALLSVILHGGLVALLVYVLEAPSSARPHLVTRANGPANQFMRSSESRAIDKLTGQALDPDLKKSDGDFNPKADVVAKVINPGVADPLAPPGVKYGDKDRLPLDVFPSRGQDTTKPGSILDGLKGPPGLEGLPPGTDLDSLRKFAGGVYGRSKSMRAGLVALGGGTSATEKAVEDGLEFLVRIRRPEGYWEFKYGEFGDKDPGFRNDVAATAFALLPFLGRGYTNEAKLEGGEENKYKAVVEKAIAHLKSRQNKKTGIIAHEAAGTPNSFDAHCLATLALCELYSLSRDEVFKEQLRRDTLEAALKALAEKQQGDGGWRFFDRNDQKESNLDVTGWVVQAFRSAELAGMPPAEAVLFRARQFVEQCADPATQGYRPSPYKDGNGRYKLDLGYAESASGLLCRMHLDGWGATKYELLTGVDNWILTPEKGLPNLTTYEVPDPLKKEKRTVEYDKQKNRVTYLFYATQVMHHLGGDYWSKWNAAKVKPLVGLQQPATAAKGRAGSWDPPRSQDEDEVGYIGGRLLCTALAILTLEVYYRQLPLYFRDLEMGAG
jgi:hypothetical protein